MTNKKINLISIDEYLERNFKSSIQLSHNLIEKVSTYIELITSFHFSKKYENEGIDINVAKDILTFLRNDIVDIRTHLENIEENIQKK